MAHDLRNDLDRYEVVARSLANVSSRFGVRNHLSAARRREKMPTRRSPQGRPCCRTLSALRRANAKDRHKSEPRKKIRRGKRRFRQVLDTNNHILHSREDAHGTGKFAFTTDDYDMFEVCFESRIAGRERENENSAF